ncbi:PDZ and LIM domain protein Zasp isoform X2 [Tribolium madens]|uniref:PDZ and LIM domain protein Zasp isoform X2 n=1 Tax=Tribolium madens TaxID=41895 RepID=UPI001CF73DBF|nr:PDZ and LIM domain protein Zasp isoform X2 [Tribolium madens]
MASLITVRLSKGDSPSLGFRLQGGKDFGTPLVIQKVNIGSPAERAGLLAGDSVIKVNNTDVFNLRHKDAQDVIIRAGPAFELTVQRGGSVWKPSVIPTGTIHTASPTSPITKTSLVANKKENIGSIGTGHNLSAKPFSAQLNGAVNGGPKLVNNQYNSPLKLYSEESIAETLSAQTEVLSTGALGVNFKKNEKNYDATNSAVYRMLQEAEKEPKTPEAEPESAVVPSAITGLRHVSAPENRPPSSNPQLPPGQNICADCERLIVGVFVRIKDKNLHVECFKCSTCGTSLKNVGYYNINNKLYCDVHAKLAARSNPPAPNLVPITVPPGGKAPASAISTALATHSLPSPSPLSPKTNLAQPFQLSQDKETNLISTPLQNLNINSDFNSPNKPNNHLLSSATPLSYSKYLNKAGNYSTTPKPFSSVSAPTTNQSFNTLPKTAPLSPVASGPAPASYSPVSSTGRSVQSIVWPPQPEEPEVPTACPLYVPPETHLRVIPKPHKCEDCEYSDATSDTKDSELEEINIMAQFQEPKLSLCSEEVSGITSGRSAVECVETITETLETQRLVESVLKNRPRSPPPLDKDIVIPEVKKPSESIPCVDCSQSNICLNKETCELKRLSEFKPNTVECKLKSQVDNAVPQQWESPMVQALRTVPEGDPFKQIPKKHSSSALASALAIAPAEPFTAQMSTHLEPVPLPEETVPYFPPEHPILVEPKEPKPEKPESKFVKALQTAPERPFSPVGAAPVKKKKNPTDEFFKDLPKPQSKLSMREALTTASDRPYTPLFMENVKINESCLKESKVERQNLQKPLKPSVLPSSFQKPLVEEKPRVPKPFPVKICEKKEEREEEKQTDVKKSTTIEKHQTHSTTEESIENVDENPQQGMYPLFKGFSCSFENKSEHSQFKIEISTTPPIINTERSQTPSVKISRTGESSESITETVTEESKTREKLKQETKEKTIEKKAEQIVLKKPLPLAGTLHKPEALPQYQVNLSESLEADLQMMQKVETSKARHEQQKIVSAPSKPPREIHTKPVITIQPGETQPHQPEQSFKPVRDDRAPCTTFSPRPRPITPSMINKLPPTIPYYQANLVAQQHKAAEVNLLNPTSPAISRSPSPCPERRRSPSPFRAAATAAAAAIRAKSPAAGPPPNPLKSNKPLPTPRDTKLEEAKKSVASYIPQYQSKIDVVEKSQVDPQMYSAYSETHNIAGQKVQSVMSGQSVEVDLAQKSMMRENRQIEDAMRTQVMTQQFAQGSASTAVREQSHSDYLEQMKRSEAQSVEMLSGGQVQVQRKKTVTEEFEHSQKSKTVEIEHNVSTTKSHPFRDVKNPQIEGQGIVGLHVTNPQPLSSPFLKQTPQQCPKLCPSSSQQCPATRPCQQFQKPPVKQVPAPSITSPIKHVSAPSGSAQKPSVNKSNIPVPRAGSGSGGGRQAGAIGVAPKRGRGVLNTAALGGTRIALCASCHSQIRGPFITALGKIWCPEHFICATPSCRRPLQDLGFVEEQGQLYCEYCFEQYLAPPCAKCGSKIKGDCLKAIGKNFHPECFNCVYCGKLFGNSPFFLEDGNPYCEADWNELFTTKCFACGFPVEAGDRWVEALNNNYHSQCFNCTMCKKNLEGQSFFAKGGRPFCKNHAR